MTARRDIRLLLADVDGTPVTQDKVLTEAAKAAPRFSTTTPCSTRFAPSTPAAGSARSLAAIHSSAPNGRRSPC